jgi:hypothetical protein
MVSLLEQYETETQQTNDNFDSELNNPVGSKLLKKNHL